MSNMKKLLLLYILTVLSSVAVFTQGNGPGFDSDWGSYFGGDNTDIITDMIVVGNFAYYTGYTNSENGIAFPEGEKNKGYDAFVARFDISTGKKDWCKYWGTEGDDYAQAIDYNKQLQLLVIAGYTKKNTGVHDIDAFTTFFNPVNGESNKSATFGGSGYDYFYDVVSIGNDVILVGKTTSSDIFTTGEQLSGPSDGMMIVYSYIENKKKWGNYFGGSEDDAVLSVGYSTGSGPNSGIYIAGTTNSDGLAVGNSTTHKAGTDVFIAKLTETGKGITWCRYFGDMKDETVTSLVLPSGTTEIIIAGATGSELNIATSDAAQQQMRGVTDGYYAILNSSNGNTLSSSYIGGNRSDTVNSVVVTPMGMIIFGTTDSDEGLSTKDDGLMGQTDVFLCNISSLNKKEWCSYYGGSGNDFAVRAAYGTQELLVAGNTYSEDFEMPPGGIEFRSPCDGFIISLDKQEDPKALTFELEGNFRKLCAGETYVARYTSEGLKPNSVLNIELSDSSGKFSKPLLLASIEVPLHSGTKEFKIPDYIITGNYILRLKENYQNNHKELNVRIFSKLKPSIDGPETVCDLHEAEYTARGDASEYSWEVRGGSIINGSKAKTVVVKWDLSMALQTKGLLKLKVWNDADCSDTAPDFNVQIKKIPDAPSITKIGDSLVSSSLENNQWYANGKLLTGESGRSVFPAWDNIYTVTVMGNGCESMPSEPYSTYFAGLPDAVNFDSLFCEESNSKILLIHNIGKTALLIDKIEITGENSTDFVAGALSDKEIDVGGTAAQQITFQPGSEGDKKAEVRISFKEGKPDKSVPLSGTKVTAGVRLSTNSIVLKDLEPEQSYDTKVILHNTSPVPVEWLTTTSSPQYFGIVSIAPPVTPANDSSVMLIRFKGSVSGSVTGTIGVEARAGNCSVKNNIAISASISEKYFSVDVDSVEAKSGDIVLITLKINNPQAAVEWGIDSIAGSLRFNSTMLKPLGGIPETVDESKHIRTVPVKFKVRTDGKIQDSFKFRVALGNDTMTAIVFDSVSSNQPAVKIMTRSGLLKLSGICSEGGPRLVYFEDEISMAVQSTVAGSNLILDLNLLENGLTKLRIYNSSGFLAQTVIDDYFSKGTYRIEIPTEGLGNGMYFVSLETPTAFIAKQIVIVK